MSQEDHVGLVPQRNKPRTLYVNDERWFFFKGFTGSEGSNASAEFRAHIDDIRASPIVLHEGKEVVVLPIKGLKK